MVRGVPVAVVDPPEEAQQLERVEPAAPGDAVLAVGRKDEVLGSQSPAGADLGRLLTQQLRPDAELTVSLQRGGLGVEAPDQDHVAEEPAQLLLAEVEVERVVVHPLALRRQQLHELGGARGRGRAEDVGQVAPEGGISSCLLGHPALLAVHARSACAAR